MRHLLQLAALLAPDAGDGGGSTVTDASTTEETTSTVTETVESKDETKHADGETKDTKAESKDGKTETKGDAKKPDPAAAKAEADRLEKAAAALELKLPKDLDAKHPSVAAFRKLAAEQGLDSAKAQKLFDAHRAELAATEKAVREATDKGGAEWLANQRKEWRGTLQKDPEYGGAKWSETKAAVARAYNKFGASDPELKAFLDDGAGDHPAVVKFLARIGRELAEDNTALKTKPKNGGTTSTDADLKALFPNSKELFT